LHHGKAASLSTMGEGLGAQPNARGLPLMGVMAAASGTGGGGRAVEVMLGEPAAHLTHAVARSSRVRVAEWNDAYSAAVQIESDDGSTTLLRVGPEAEVLPPGVVMDGIDLRSAGEGP
jgi:hypothetical protein